MTVALGAAIVPAAGLGHNELLAAVDAVLSDDETLQFAEEGVDHRLIDRLRAARAAMVYPDPVEFGQGDDGKSVSVIVDPVEPHARILICYTRAEGTGRYHESIEISRATRAELLALRVEINRAIDMLGARRE